MSEKVHLDLLNGLF